MLGPGISSESMWTPFEATTTASVRELRWSLNISWLRNEDAGAGFAIVDASVIGGTDFIKGLAGTVTNADIYEHTDETARVVALRYSRSLPEPSGGISTCLMDVTLQNTDRVLSPNIDPTIGTAILPKRPINAHIGFYVNSRQMTVPVFKGLTKMPRENKGTRLVHITSQDYISYLQGVPMEAAKYVSQRSDVIIASILSDLGFGSSQYELDTGLNTIGFAYFEKGVSAGYRIKKICEAEEALFYQDEEGILRFENRRHYSVVPHTESQIMLEEDDIIAWQQDESTPIINKVVVKAKPLVIRSNQDVWQSAEEVEIASGATAEVWANFIDPVNEITDPAETTDYTAFTGTGGTGSNISSDIDTTITKFVTAAKLEITNNNVSKAYVNLLKLRGTPATSVDTSGKSSQILEVYEDANSINKYDEHEYTIENDFIDSSTFASYLAEAIVTKYKDPMKRVRITVRGIPHLQLRDKITIRGVE